VTAFVVYKTLGEYKCPECGQTGKLHDHRIRRWRHLDSCNHKTLIEASVPRIECKEHGIKQIPVVWAEKNSRFTLEFESAVLLWLKEDPIATVATNFSISWDEVDGIMHRAVKRGMARRKQTKPQHIGIDETSFQKRHEYVTIILDKDTDSVIDVLEDRKAQTLKEWLETQQKSDFSTLTSISMDMWDPFINAVSSHFKNAAQIIAFDRFHVAQHFAKALNKVRAAEHQFLGENSPLSRSKYQWLKNSGRLDNRNKERRDFLALSRMNLKTSRAWRIKEVASTLWTYSYLGAAERNWKALLSWISHCQLQPMATVGRMIRRYF
jgi:transposase